MLYIQVSILFIVLDNKYVYFILDFYPHLYQIQLNYLFQLDSLIFIW